MKLSTLTILVVAAAGVLLTANPATAQSANKPRGDRGVTAQRERSEPKLLKELSRVCNLNAQQYGQVKLILEARNNQARAIKQGSTNPAEMREKMRELQRETWAKIEALLTPQQRAAWEAHMKSKKKDREAPKPPPNPGATPGKKPGKGG